MEVVGKVPNICDIRALLWELLADQEGKTIKYRVEDHHGYVRTNIREDGTIETNRFARSEKKKDGEANG